MRSNRVIVALSLFLGAGSLYGQNIEQVYTKDGSCYEGYISEQVPGERVDVYAIKAKIHIPESTARNERTEIVPFSSLPEYARQYLRDEGDTVSIKWTTLKTDEDIYDGIYRKGSPHIIVFSPRTYSIPWDQITYTTKTPLSGDPWGIKEVVSDGMDSYEGTITKQITGESMDIQDLFGGTRNVKYGSVDRVTYECINADSTIWKQAPLCDRIITLEGDRLEGLIIMKDLARNRIIIQTKDHDGKESVRMSDVKLFQKYPNTSYHPYQVPPVDTTKFIKLDGNEVQFSYLHKQRNENWISGSPEDRTAKPNAPYLIKKGIDSPIIVHNLPAESSVEVYRVNRKKGLYYIADWEETDPVLEKDFRDSEGDKEVSIRIKKTGDYFVLIGKQDNKKGDTVRTGLLINVADSK